MTKLLTGSWVFFTLLFLLSLFIVPTTTRAVSWTGSQPNIFPEFLPHNHPSVVMVICNDKYSETKFQGSGFFINQSGDVITSYHIIDGHRDIQIRTQTKKLYKVKEVLSKDVFGDLARLAINIPEDQVKHVKLSSDSPKEGEEIIVIGHPLGHRQTISYGKISSLFPVQRIGHLLQFNAPITKGSSGSPIFNLTGEVIGVTSFMLFPGPNQPSINFAIPVASFENI